jgi:excisionase family DNA binding protein
MEKVMKCGEVADYLKLSEATIRKWVRLGKIPYRKFGTRVRFLGEELERWMNSAMPDMKKR